MFFDDLEILRTVDRCEREGLTASLSSGLDLLQEVLRAPHPVHDDDTCRSFVYELELAKDANLLSFTVMSTGGGVAPASVDSMGANNYLAYLRDFRLTPFGHDRARCRVYERELPDPGEDDGKPITHMTFKRITAVLVATYDEHELELFLLDGGIPREMIPSLGDDGAGLADLFALFNGGSSNVRRVLRDFLGRWLAQELDSGPNADQERELLGDLARQGWFVRDAKVVRGEPIRRATAAPLLGGDLLVNLHPAIQEAARPFFSVGNRAAAVFEAFKAIELRVRELIGSDRTGMPLMGEAFDGDAPRLALNDHSDPPDIDEQRGFALIFKGSSQGIRNPKAHAPFEELEERRTLDYLGLASLLMRRLDDAEERLARAAP
jgi:uncharacterized protein (TIGR02391 family)